MFDESTDLSGKAQICILLRYVYFSSNIPIVREDFVGFIDAFGELMKAVSNSKNEVGNVADEDGSEDSDDEREDIRSEQEEVEEMSISEEVTLSGVNIGRLVVKDLQGIGLDLLKCVAVGTDGCPAMIADRGAVTEIQTVATNALKTPCFSHELNNSISQSVKVGVVQKASKTIWEVTRFFIKSRPKRNSVLAKYLGKKLVQLCTTRWVERRSCSSVLCQPSPDSGSAIENFRVERQGDI